MIDTEKVRPATWPQLLVTSVHYVMLQSMIFFHCMLVIGMAGPRSTKLLGEDKLMLLHFWCKKQKGPVLIPTHAQ